jgi:hypothetical protein
MAYVEVETGQDKAHFPARNAYERIGFKKAIEMGTCYLKL